MSLKIAESGYNGGTSTTYTLCNGSIYAQTLFLGCSVKSYNSSLGWGSDASKLEVELVEDSCEYPILTDINGNIVERPNGSNEYIYSRLNNTFKVDKNGQPLVPGKVYYQPEGNSLVSKYYYGPDPGFYGDDKYNKDGILIKPALDLMGVPVYFKYDNFEFYGIIQNWENMGDPGNGTKNYRVTIESPSNLINNVQMILGNYHGTIFRRDPEDSYGFPGYVRRPDEIYGGTISQQNIPNIINVYGFLEQSGFGNSGRNDEGIPALNIINAIDYLLSSSFPDNSVFKFSPFGRILGRCPTYANNGAMIDDSYTMGIIYPVLDRMNIYRSMYSVNILDLLDNEAIYLLSHYRISQSSITLQEFISILCSVIGREYYLSFTLNINNGIIFPAVSLNTISTLRQTDSGAIDDFIYYAKNLGTTVKSYSRGKEYNATAPIRSMIIGGKQQRLYQVKNTKYAVKQSTLRYNPLANQTVTGSAQEMIAATVQGGSFVEIDHSIGSYYRMPDINSTRNPNLAYGDSSRLYYGKVEVPDPSYFNGIENVWDLLGTVRGNYKPTTTMGGAIGIDYGQLFPASDSDSICPYFGKDALSGGIRKVYSTDAGFVVEFMAQDIGLAIGYNFPNIPVYITENEIRAAMSGPDAYIEYLFQVTGVFSSPEARSLFGYQFDIINKIIIPIIGDEWVESIAYGPTINGFFNTTKKFDNIPLSCFASSVGSDPIAYTLVNRLQKFFGNIGNEYYGQKFMVNVPNPSYWIDSRPFNPPIPIGIEGQILLDGTQKTYYSFEPTDYAWEEPGNMIDDSLLVGSSSMDIFTNDNGAIEPIVGYNESYQFNYLKAYASAWASLNTNAEVAALQGIYNFFKYDFAIIQGQTTKHIPYLSTNNNLPIENYFEPVLAIDSDVAKISVEKNYNMLDAYSKTASRAKKLYTKATVDKTLEKYITLNGTVQAKAIITTPKININPIYSKALSAHTAAWDFVSKGFADEFWRLNFPRFRVIAQQVCSLSPSKTLLDLERDILDAARAAILGEDYYDESLAMSQADNLSIAPKAAVPAFAAIPIVFNNAVYGPWVNSPDLAASNIFTNNYSNRIENLVGGTNLEINENLVPWNYGGMRVLDEAALQLVGSQNNYNISQEMGQLVTYGLPLLSLGNELKAFGSLFNGPIVNNIQVQIDSNGPVTTYSFRSFTKKFALFNKDNADKLAVSAKNTIAFNRDLNQKIRSAVEKIGVLSQNVNTANNYYRTAKLQEYSPMSVLVGYSFPFTNTAGNSNRNKLIPGNITKDSVIQQNVVSLQELRELPQEFYSMYSSKSFMSLDGLLTPVSFYPSLAKNTAYYSKYTTANCPACNGSKYYKDYNNIQRYCDYCDYNISTSNDSSVDLKDLNPIISPYGQFRNGFAQASDFNAHNIDIVGRSLVPMMGSLSFKANIAAGKGDDYQYYDTNEMEFSSKFDLPTSGPYLNNYRFLALRGPLVVNGWGFDVDGYPVPNASGEPKEVDAKGNPKKISSKTDQNGSFDPAYNGYILGKNQEWDDEKGEWKDPTKENYFAKGWGLRPDTWPVGPVDLRWNEKRKVWTMPDTEILMCKTTGEWKKNSFATLTIYKAPAGSGKASESTNETISAYNHYYDITGSVYCSIAKHRGCDYQLLISEPMKLAVITGVKLESTGLIFGRQEISVFYNTGLTPLVIPIDSCSGVYSST